MREFTKADDGSFASNTHLLLLGPAIPEKARHSSTYPLKRIVRANALSVNPRDLVMAIPLRYYAATQTNTCLIMTFKRNNETDLTYALKWAAWEWLHTVARCQVIGFEVAFEGPGGRIVDVAGVSRNKELYVVEVKSSLADFRRDDNDSRDQERLRKKEEANDRMASLTQEILEGAGDEDAAAQATLDIEMLTHRSTKLKEQAGRLSTKFHDPRFVRVADYNYLMVPSRTVRRNQLPPLWGLLAPTPKPHAVIEAPRVGGNRPPYMYAAVLRAIARSNTRDMMRVRGAESSPVSH